MAGRVTLQDRCLLHLLDRAGAAPGDAAAEDLLQDRIAEACQVQRAHVSRAMKALRRRGWVREAKIHVRGEGRRRVAYFLTHDGVGAAKRTRERLEARTVAVVDLEGREATRRLYEVPALLPRRPRFSDLLGAVESGRLDLRAFLERQARVHRGRVYDVRGAIQAPHFQGRGVVLNRLDAFAEDPRSRGLLLSGLPGIGKTAAASRWIRTWQGRRHVLWRRLGPGTSRSEVLRDLAATMHAAGRPALSDALHRPREGSGDVERLLHRDLAGLPAILVYDDAHAAMGEVADLIGGLLQVDGDARGPKVVLLAREVPRFLAAEDVARGRVWREGVDDLPRADADAMLASMGVDAPRREAIAARCGGHPLSLELAAAGGMPLDAVRRTSIALLAEAVLSRIGEAEREALSLAAVFEDPVPADALGAHARSLWEWSLLRDAGDGRVTVHGLVRDAVLDGLPADRVRELRVRAAEILVRSGEPQDELAALRHLLAAGAFRDAGALAVSRGGGIIDGGLAEPLAPILARLSKAGRGGDAPHIHLLRGHALAALGRWQEAARAYEACESPDDRVSAEALLGRGKAELHRRSRLALPLLEDARGRLERLGALRAVAEAQYWIGCVHENAGRLDEAREAFERGRTVAFDVGDRRWEGMCGYGVGRILSRRKDFAGAVREEREALRLLEREGHRLDVAKVCAGVGGNLLELLEMDEAETYLGRAAAEARATGTIGILASTLFNLASVRKEAGRLNEAARLFQECSELYEQQEQCEEVVRCAAWLAVCVARQAPSLAEEHFRRAESLLARASRQLGWTRTAKRHLSRAIAEAKAGMLADLVADLSAERRTLA